MRSISILPDQAHHAQPPSRHRTSTTRCFRRSLRSCAEKRQQKRPSLQMTCFVIWSVAGFIEDCATRIDKIPIQKCVLLCAVKKFICSKHGERNQTIVGGLNDWNPSAMPHGALRRRCEIKSHKPKYDGFSGRDPGLKSSASAAVATPTSPTGPLASEGEFSFYQLNYRVVLSCELLSQASTSCKKVRTSEEKLWASGRSGRVSSAGIGFGSSQTILVGDAHPLSISAKIDRITTSSIQRILRFDKLLVSLAALQRPRNGGLKL